MGACVCVSVGVICMLCIKEVFSLFSLDEGQHFVEHEEKRMTIRANERME